MPLVTFSSATLRLHVCWEEIQVCPFLLWEGNPQGSLIFDWGTSFCLASLDRGAHLHGQDASGPQMHKPLNLVK